MLKYITLAILLSSNFAFAGDDGVLTAEKQARQATETEIVQREIDRAKEIKKSLNNTGLSLVETEYKDEIKELETLKKNIQLGHPIDVNKEVREIEDKHNFMAEAFYG